MVTSKHFIALHSSLAVPRSYFHDASMAQTSLAYLFKDGGGPTYMSSLFIYGGGRVMLCVLGVRKL